MDREQSAQTTSSLGTDATSDSDEADDWPTVHRTVPASASPRAHTRAPRSIFDVADGLSMRVVHPSARERGGPQPPAVTPLILREHGLVRYVQRWSRMETPEGQEQERARRAKQRPPKPIRKARTRSKKLLRLIGEAGDD